MYDIDLDVKNTKKENPIVVTRDTNSKKYNKKGLDLGPIKKVRWIRRVEPSSASTDTASFFPILKDEKSRTILESRMIAQKLSLTS